MNKAKRNNIMIRVASVVIAIIMWSYVMSEVNPPTTQEFTDIEVEYLNTGFLAESDLVIMEPKEAKVTVKLSGRRSDVREIKPSDIIVQADLWGSSEGTNRISVEVIPPDNVSVESVSPGYIPLKLDSIITKDFGITLRTQGNTEEGYTLGNGEIRPNTVLVKGPRSWVNSVSSVVATVDVSKASEDIKTSSSLRILDDKGAEVKGVEKEPNMVDIVIPVLATKTIPVNPRITGVPQDGYSITDIQLNPKEVKIKGRKEILDVIEFLETEPIDIEGINASDNFDTALVLPEGVEIMGEKINFTVEVNVEKIIEKEIPLSTEKLSFINLDTSLIIDKENLLDSITLAVKGIESRVENLNENNITYYSDLLGLEEGTHNIDVEVVLQEGIELLYLEPKTIEIVLKKDEVIQTDDESQDDSSQIDDGSQGDGNNERDNAGLNEDPNKDNKVTF